MQTLPVLTTNGRYAGLLAPLSTVASSSSVTCDCASVYEIRSQFDDWRQGYNVISMSQDGGLSIANLLHPSGVVTPHV